MAWDFTIDSEIQDDLSKKLKQASTDYQGKVDSLYGIIDGELHTAWIGEDYDQYKVSTDGYKTALTDLGKTINMFGLHYESMKTGTENLATALIAIVNDLTGSGGVTVANGVTPTTYNGGDQGTGGNGQQNGQNGGTVPTNLSEASSQYQEGHGSVVKSGTVTNPDGSTTSYQQFSDGTVYKITTHQDGTQFFECYDPNTGDYSQGYTTTTGEMYVTQDNGNGTSTVTHYDGNGGKETFNVDSPLSTTNLVDGNLPIPVDAGQATSPNTGQNTNPSATPIVGQDGTQYDVIPRGDNGVVELGNGYQYAVQNADGSTTVLTYVGANGSYPGQSPSEYTYQFRDENGQLHTMTQQQLSDAGYERVIPHVEPAPTGGTEQPTGGTQVTPTPSGQGNTANSAPVTLNRGTTVSIAGGSYSYFGTTNSGVNVYADGSGNLYYQSGNSMAPVMTDTFPNGGYQPTKAQATTENYNKTWQCSAMGETWPQEATLYFGEGSDRTFTHGNQLNSSITYANGADAPQVTGALTGSSNGDSTYQYLGSTFTPSQVTNSATLNAATGNGQNIVIPAGTKFTYDPPGLLNTETISNGSTDVYLIYDPGTGLYYKGTADGGYSTNTTGYDLNDRHNSITVGN